MALTLSAVQSPPSLAQPPGAAGPDAAVAAVEEYVAAYRGIEPPPKLAERLAGHWDWDAVSGEVFGADSPPAGTPARKAVTAKLTQLFGAFSADGPTLAVMRQVRVVQPCGVLVGPDRAAVSFIATLPDGRAVNNLFVLRRGDGGWKLVEAANGGRAGRAGFVRSLATSYMGVRGKQTPTEFIDATLRDFGAGKRE